MVRPESVPRIWRVAVLGLVVLDVVLVAVVLGIGSGSSTVTTTAGTQTTPSSRHTASSSPSSPTPSPTSPTPSPTTESPTPAASSAVPVRRLLVAVDDRRAWRVSTGSCSGSGARISVTTDGGRTWDERPEPLAFINRLVVRTGSASVFAVGADGGCDPKLRRGDDRGTTWAAADGLDGFFYTDPQDPGSVAVPGRGTVQACGGRSILDLAVDGGDLRVLCPDGRLRTIGDGDATWTDGPRVTGAVAISTSHVGPERTYLARVGAAGCAGVQIVDADRLGDPVACVRRTDPVSPGSVSVSIAGTAGWLLVGGDLYTSGDTLADWTAP